MNPIDFIIRADAMGANEDEHRSAISRYYYGVYNRLKSDLAKPPHSIVFKGSPADHGLVRQHVPKLDTLPSGTGRSAQGLVDDLRDLRNLADYDLHLVVGPGDRANAKGLVDAIRKQTGGW